MNPLTIEAHGSSYRIHDPGGIIGKCLVGGDPYERKVLERIYREELAGGLAVDVGASIGNHSLWFAAICGLNVIAVEPLDFKRLEENVALNPDLDIEVWPFGLGDRLYTGEVVGAPAHVIGDTFPTEGVRIRRLDDLNLSAPLSLLKVDIEGMEPQMIRGGIETIRRDRPLIFAEAIKPAAHRRVAAVLEPLGYRHHKTYGATPLEEWVCDQ
jgi:FkbM family methyltransferase